MNALANKTAALGALLDIELPVTLRFGRARLRLGDVLELEPESLLELDRAAAEPVDMIVNGRLIARGEVVEIEGNYGLRVLEVVSQGERLNASEGAY